MNGSNQHDKRNFLSTLPRIQNVKIVLFNVWSSKNIKDFYQTKQGVSPLCNDFDSVLVYSQIQR